MYQYPVCRTTVNGSYAQSFAALLFFPQIAVAFSATAPAPSFDSFLSARQRHPPASSFLASPAAPTHPLFATARTTAAQLLSTPPAPARPRPRPDHVIPKEKWRLAVADFTFHGIPKIFQRYVRPARELLFIELKKLPLRHFLSEAEQRERAALPHEEAYHARLKERAHLQRARDFVSLHPVSDHARRLRTAAFEKQIKEKEQEIERARVEVRTARARFFRPWLQAEVLVLGAQNEPHALPERFHLATHLRQKKLSALVTGKLVDVAGYVRISLYLSTGLEAEPTREFTLAGPYRELPRLMHTLSAQLRSAIENAQPVRIVFDVHPPHARLSFQGVPVEDLSKPLISYPGRYVVDVSAAGYFSATKEIYIENRPAFSLRVRLVARPQHRVRVQLTDNSAAPIFSGARSVGVTPFSTVVTDLREIFTVGPAGARSFAFIERGTFPNSQPSTLVLPAPNPNATQDLAYKRDVAYWSFGALCIAVPIALILGSTLADTHQALERAKAARAQPPPPPPPPAPAGTGALERKSQHLLIGTGVAVGVAVILSINFIVHAARYLNAVMHNAPQAVRPRADKDIQTLTHRDEAEEDQEEDS